MRRTGNVKRLFVMIIANMDDSALPTRQCIDLVCQLAFGLVWEVDDDRSLIDMSTYYHNVSHVTHRNKCLHVRFVEWHMLIILLNLGFIQIPD